MMHFGFIEVNRTVRRNKKQLVIIIFQDFVGSFQTVTFALNFTLDLRDL